MEKRKPNVVIIMTDQHRADYMSCTGKDTVKTPCIDKIAKNGLRFENAYCPYPVCLPSRSSMLSGLHAHTTGAYLNFTVLDARYRTMANHFSEAGYMTGLIGKMHFNDACTHGFQYYMSVNDWLMYLGPKAERYAEEIGSFRMYVDSPFRYNDDGSCFPDKRWVWPEEDSPWKENVQPYDELDCISRLSEEDQLDAFVARESNTFIDRYQDRPFFLITSFLKPHLPHIAPKRFAERYPLKDMSLQEPGDLSLYPQKVRNFNLMMDCVSEDYRKIMKATYRANLEFVDECVGAVYDHLESLGLLENTIIVYTSDHGEMDGEHGLFQKGMNFDAATKVPLIFSMPGVIPTDEVSSAIIEQIGLFPTLAELTGTGRVDCTPLAPMENAPSCLDGESFAKNILDVNAKGLDGAYSEWGVPGNMQYMLREEQYKVGLLDTGEVELYDLKNDAQENHNLAYLEEYQEIFKPLLAKLKKKVQSFAPAPPALPKGSATKK